VVVEHLTAAAAAAADRGVCDMRSMAAYSRVRVQQLLPCSACRAAPHDLMLHNAAGTATQDLVTRLPVFDYANRPS
jgi:hypothetical protein